MALVVLIVIGGLGALGALACGVLLALGRRVPPWAAALPVALPLLAATAAMSRGARRAELAGIEASGERWWAELSRMILELAPQGQLLAAAAMVAAALLLLGAAVGGARRGPRKVGGAVVVGVLTLLLAASPLLMLDGSGIHTPMLRGGAYLLLGGLAAVAALGGDGEGAGSESATAAGLALFLAVSAGEMIAALHTTTLIHQALAEVSEEMALTLFSAGHAEALKEQLLSALAVVLAGLAAATAAGGAPAGRRRVHAALGLVLLPLGVLAVLSAGPQAATLRALNGWWARALPQGADVLQYPALPVSEREPVMGPWLHITDDEFVSAAGRAGRDDVDGLRELLPRPAASDAGGAVMLLVHKGSRITPIHSALAELHGAGWREARFIGVGEYGHVWMPVTLGAEVGRADQLFQAIIGEHTVRLYAPAVDEDLLIPCEDGCASEATLARVRRAAADTFKPRLPDHEIVSVIPKPGAYLEAQTILAVADTLRADPDSLGRDGRPAVLFPDVRIWKVSGPPR